MFDVALQIIKSSFRTGLGSLHTGSATDFATSKKRIVPNKRMLVFWQMTGAQKVLHSRKIAIFGKPSQGCF
jgi:hypothetical protein